MDFNLTPAEETFRDEVRAFIREHAPKKSADPKAIGTWWKKVREKRWVGFSWPKEYGGGGGSVMEQAILKEEMSRAQAPPLGSCMMGLAWVGPAIIEYGTDAQKKKFIPDILDGKYHWCTGYSEPGSGSDLASLQCRAVRDGDHYVVNGQKIWTSIAMWSKWMILLVRTSQGSAKHDGITCLLVPMDTPGMTVRPIKNMSGGAMFAEVFFDGVRVPVENRLGAEGEGTRAMMRNLEIERLTLAAMSVGIAQRCLRVMIDYANERKSFGVPLREHGQIQRYLAETFAEYRAAKALVYDTARRIDLSATGQRVDADASKLFASQVGKRAADAAIQVLGGYGYMGEYVVARLWRDAKLLEIGGGTLEAHHKNLTKDLTRDPSLVR
jgi:isovaleryl-CoA dehydrogenase